MLTSKIQVHRDHFGPWVAPRSSGWWGCCRASRAWQDDGADVHATRICKLRGRCSPFPSSRQLLIAVGTAGRQLPARGSSGHRWTSTGDLPIPVGTAGPQPPDGMPDRTTNYISDRMSENRSEYMSDRMPECLLDRMSKRMPENKCQVECQNICQMECQNICRIECQNICQMGCQIDCQIG